MNLYNGGDFNNRIFELLNENFCDVQFLVRQGSEEWRFPADKLILSTISPVLKDILENKDSTRCPSQTTICVDDLTPNAVASMISFVSGEPLRLTSIRGATDVLRAARKYEIDSLKHRCEDYLLACVNLRNVCDILKTAVTFRLSNLKASCINLCASAAFVTFRTSGFYFLRRDTLMEILSRPHVALDNVMDLIRHLWAWSTSECCRLGLYPDVTNITFVMSPFKKFVDWMSLEKYLYDIEDNELRLYVDDQMSTISRFSSNDGKGADGASSVDKYGIRFPLNLPPHHFSRFETTILCRCEAHSTGYCMEVATFVVDRPCYLIKFSVSSRWTGDSENQLRKLEIGDTKPACYSWRHGQESSFRIVSCVKRLASKKATEEIAETEFEATCLLRLEENKEYTVTLYPGVERAYWPPVKLQHDSNKGVQMKLVSVASYALASVTLLEQ